MRIVPPSDRVFEGTEDEKLAIFRQICGQIGARVQGWLEEQGAVQQKL